MRLEIKWLFCLCTFVLVTDTVGQVHFFVNPNINFKTSLAFADPTQTNQDKVISPNQFFYTPYGISHSARIIEHQSFQYGFSGGVIYKNGLRKIELGWNKDAAHFRFSSYFRGHDQEAHSGAGVNYFGVGLNRYSINYSVRMKGIRGALQPWISFGTGVFTNLNSYAGRSVFEWDLALNSNGDRLIRSYFQAMEDRRINGFFKIGFEADVFIKNKFLCSLNASYIQGLGVVSNMEYVHDYLINNEQVSYQTRMMSRGSGFYWGISRLINLCPRAVPAKRLNL